MKRVLKWDVPVDDAMHPVGSGRVLAVACQHGPDSVQVWTEEPAETPAKAARSVIVVGTGQPIPNESIYLGTALCLDGRLVWHVYAEPRP